MEQFWASKVPKDAASIRHTVTELAAKAPVFTKSLPPMRTITAFAVFAEMF